MSAAASSLYRYRAVAVAGGADSHSSDARDAGEVARDGSGASKPIVLRGELSGESAAEVRAKLRAGGLQVLELSELAPRWQWPQLRLGAGLFDSLRAVSERHLRARRHALKEEACDGLATLIESGVPLVEALDTLARGEAVRRPALRRLLAASAERVRAGESLAAALREQRGWFDAVEIALLDAAEHGGTLSETLTRLAARQAKQSEVGQKIASALIYPAVVSLVGIGVWLFLSNKTLPELAQILESARVEVPRLTAVVMASGRFVREHAVAIAVAAGALMLLAAWGLPAVRRKFGWLAAGPFGALRRLRLARATTALAELLQGGVPLVEGLKAVAPTAGAGALRESLLHSAGAIEQGQNWSQTLGDGRLYPSEYVRLVEMGETSGELAPLLARLSERMERSAERQIARAAALMEPAAILLLATLIGIVVAAAVLPLTRLQGIV